MWWYVNDFKMELKSNFSSTEEKNAPPRRNKKSRVFRLLVYQRLGVLTLPEKTEVKELLEEGRNENLEKASNQQSTSQEEVESSKTTKSDNHEEWEVSVDALSWGDCMIDSKVGRQKDAQMHNVHGAWNDGDKGEILSFSQMNKKDEEELLACQNHRNNAWNRLLMREHESTSSDDESQYDGPVH
ncbi:uncharacterized protein LOC118432363 isoform X2 [Branchiostoma floridae]|uniref:Uncharacterized protein LOC118432363 isoform X2 n=1 Tax=Branchiostoma floridae TaxID=7739 RepID=A0A9J7MEN3_BRAFL|nr:uncharacterized protein LOC118432363 isoform X2 [Branchiostoma floridae]